jgi:hypothetical protein
MSIDRDFLDGAVTDGANRLPIHGCDPKGSRAGDVGAAQKITLSDLNIDPGQQDLVSATEQLEYGGNPITP